MTVTRWPTRAEVMVEAILRTMDEHQGRESLGRERVRRGLKSNEENKMYNFTQKKLRASPPSNQKQTKTKNPRHMHTSVRARQKTGVTRKVEH